ncbi:MAG TPA: hypothetical protein VF033_07545 [Steroidobacteraceae bacterium]
MPMWLTNFFDGQNMPTTLHGNEHGDLPVDDSPPAERPSEQYAAWRATAIFTMAPFSAPPGR